MTIEECFKQISIGICTLAIYICHIFQITHYVKFSYLICLHTAR